MSGLIIEGVKWNAAAVLSANESDSSGAGGIQADVRTFAALGVHPLSVITQIAARGGHAGDQSLPMPTEAVVTQWTQMWETFGAQAVKIAAPATPKTAGALGRLVESLSSSNPEVGVVLDPRLFNKFGHRCALEALDGAMGRLLTHTTVLMANVFEAEALTGVRAWEMSLRADAVRALADRGPDVVVLMSSQNDRHAVDFVWDGSGVVELGADRFDGGHHVGASAIFSASLSAHMARGQQPLDALEAAKAFVGQSIDEATTVGQRLECANPLGKLYRQQGVRYGILEPKKGSLV